MSEEEKKLLEDVEATVKHINEVREIIATQKPNKTTIKGIQTPEGNSFTVTNERKEVTTGVKDTGKGFKIKVGPEKVTTNLVGKKNSATRAKAEKYFEDLKKLRENPELTQEQKDEIDQILVPLQASFDRANRGKVEKNQEEQKDSEHDNTSNENNIIDEKVRTEKLKEIIEMEKEYQALIGKSSPYEGKNKNEIPIGILLQAEKLNEKILTEAENLGLTIEEVIKAYEAEMKRIEIEKKNAERKEPTLEEQLTYIEQQLAIEEENLMNADEFEAPGISEAIFELQRNRRELEEKQKSQEEANRKFEEEEKRKSEEEARKKAEEIRIEELKQKITETKVRMKASQILVSNIANPKNTEKSQQQVETWIICKEFLGSATGDINKYYEELNKLSGQQSVDEIKKAEIDIEQVREEIIKIREQAKVNAETMQAISDKYEKDRINKNIQRAQKGIGKKAQEINEQIHGETNVSKEEDKLEENNEKQQEEKKTNPYGRRARREVTEKIELLENEIKTLQKPIEGMSDDERVSKLAKLQAALEFEQGKLDEINEHWNKIYKELNPQVVEKTDIEKISEPQDGEIIKPQLTEREEVNRPEQQTQQMPVVVKEKGIMAKFYENINALISKVTDAIKMRKINKALTKAVNQYMQLNPAEKYAYISTSSLDGFFSDMSESDRKIAEELGGSLIEESENSLEKGIRNDYLRSEKNCKENAIQKASSKIHKKAIGTFEKNFQKAIELYGSLSQQGKETYAAYQQYDDILEGVKLDISRTELQKIIYTFTRIKNIERIRQPEVKQDIFEHVEIDNSSPEQAQEQTQTRQPRAKGNTRGRNKAKAQRMSERRSVEKNDDGAIDAEFIPIPDDDDLFMENVDDGFDR